MDKRLLAKYLNKLAFRMQRRHMAGKITREVVTTGKAIFHPVDWNLKVTKKLLNYKSI